MKNSLLVLSFGLILATTAAFAQTSTVTTVTVVATDPIATEPAEVMNFVDTGIFTITRQGPTNLSLAVFFSLSGTASNGVDYFEVTSPVTIPEGQRTARVQIAPKHDDLVEGEERVILRLEPSPMAGPLPGYAIGPSNTATAVVVIRDPAPPSNSVPVVTWVQPVNGATFPPGIPIIMRARATDSDGTVSFVDFFAAPSNGAQMQVGRSTFGGTNNTYTVVWSNAPAGQFRLHAEAVDNAGGRGSSDFVQISVGGGTNAPPTNAPPVVRISSPAEGTSFPAGANIGIAAETVDPDGWVPKVEFFANDAKIGESVITFIVAPPDGTPIAHEFKWLNVAPGNYTLTARGTDDEGRIGTSPPVRIIVGGGTNQPPMTIVSIVATDPQGSEIPEVPPGMERPQLYDPAIFTVTRHGILSNALTVYYTVDGTAKNGLDYVEIPFNVRIPEGAASVDIKIDVIDDQLVEGTETVRIQIVPPPCPAIFPPPPECYTVGGPGVALPWVAEARILDDDSPTNLPPRTVVSIVATDPEGSEIPEVPPGMGMPQRIDPAIFTVTRTGVLSNALTVYYLIGGTASNGVDYVEIPRLVQIPHGARSADIEIEVIDDRLVEGTESVRIQLIPPPCIAIFPPPPECYLVGAPGVAEAKILDNDEFVPSNRPPVVSIVVPTNGAVFTAPADIQLIATAFDTDGYVATVEFFEGTNSLGVTTNNPLVANALNPFQLKWPNVPPGHYMLTALATDDKGAQSRSRPVFISVIGENRQTVVNIRTIDPEAAEQSPLIDVVQNNALMRVTRTGSTDIDLPVYYRVEGTAENGVDYVRLNGTVVIPKGSESADIVIQAIDDKLVERTESVLVGIEPPVCIAIFPPPPECYLVGSASRASAFILDDEPFETNSPPRVEITRPASGATFRAPADIHIVAKTVDRDGYVGKVEFFANNHKIGEASKLFLIPPPDGSTIEYEFDWKGVGPGPYALTARAIDDEGAAGLSAPVRILVVGTNEPPPTNVTVVTVYAIDGYASEGGIVLTNDPRMLLPYNTNGTIRNVAVFEIRRSGGNADLPLRVFYEMHGTATEGVDYLDLPEIAEIPAGARSTRVTIVPLDDQIPEKLESVIICLRPSPLAGSILPGYVVGRPGEAAAVIADNDARPEPYFCLGDGLIHWCSPAANGQCFRIEASRDLAEWRELCTLRAADGALHYTDAEGGAYDRRFYRAVPVPCPPDQP